MNKIAYLLERLRAIFADKAHFIQHLESLQGDIWLVDKEGTTEILATESQTEEQEPQVFRIENAAALGFVPIDGKGGILGYGDSHCDCLFFDEWALCFLEFKTNATSLKKVDKNRSKAAEQLGNTLQLIDEKLQNEYNGLEREAYMRVPDLYPRASASLVQIRAEFLETHGVPLLESKLKRCGRT